MTKNFTEELLNCCAHGPLDKVKTLLRQGASVDVRNPRGHTLLQVALRHGQWGVARYLHRKYPQLATVNSQRLPCLLAASQNKKDDPEGLELCLSRLGGSLNDTDAHGRSALLTACLQGHLKKTKWLLARGADVNQADQTGRTALMEATEASHVALVRALLKAGAQPNAADGNGDTALLCAMRAKKPNLTLIKMLLGNQADPEQRNHQGVSPWLLAKQKHKQALEVIEKHINSQRQIELPLFDSTAQNKKSTQAITTAHMSATIKPSGKNRMENHVRTTATPLAPAPKEQDLKTWFAAARSGHMGTLNRLLLNGMDINAVDKQGCTAVIRAAGAGHRATVAFLLQRKADIHHRSNNGSTVLSAAILANQRTICRLLLKHGADASGTGPGNVPLVLLAAAQWSEDQLLALHQQGADLSVQDKQKRTALHCAALACEFQHNLPAGKALFQFLLQHHLDLTQPDSHGLTPLEILCGGHKPHAYQAPDSRVATLLHSILQLPAAAGVIHALMPKLLASCERHGLSHTRGILLAGGS